MKYVIPLSFLFSFLACNSDDTKSSISPELAGFYILQDAELENPMDYNGDGVASSQLRDELPSCFKMSFYLQDNFDLYRYSDGIQVNGDVYNFDCDAYNSYHGIWAQDGDVIVQHGKDGVTRREPFYFEGKDIVVEREDSIFGKMTIYFDRSSR